MSTKSDGHSSSPAVSLYLAPSISGSCKSGRSRNFFSRSRLARCRHRLVPPCLRRAPPLQKRYWAKLGHHFGSGRHDPRHRRALPHPLPDLRRQRQRGHALWQLRGLTSIATVYVKQISAHSTCACVHLLRLHHRCLLRSSWKLDTVHHLRYSVVSDDDMHKLPASRDERADGGHGSELSLIHI